MSEKNGLLPVVYMCNLCDPPRTFEDKAVADLQARVSRAGG